LLELNVPVPSKNPRPSPRTVPTKHLEELVRSSPGLGPAFVVRDPRCSVPLGNSPRYRALVAHLEKEMADHARRLDEMA
jgi:hypothetical protein